MDLYEHQGKELFGHYGIPVSEGRLATTPEEARRAAEELGGQVVVKAQVDIGGHVVRRVWIERASEIAKEYYLSITFDRGSKSILLMLTTEGGVDIEEVAAEKPDAIARLHVDPL